MYLDVTRKIPNRKTLVKLRISNLIIQQIVTLSKNGHDALEISHP